MQGHVFIFELQGYGYYSECPFHLFYHRHDENKSATMCGQKPSGLIPLCYCDSMESTVLQLHIN